jgi:hypothetical protein
MKTLLKTTLFLLCGCICGLISCSDENEEQGQQVDPLVMTASTETVQLNEEKNDQIAVSFSWAEGLKPEAEYSITYIFRLDIANNNFQTSTEPEEMPAGISTKSYTHKELNDLITKHWKKVPGETVNLEARIVAKVTGPKFRYPQIGIVPISIGSYVMAPKPLFITGSATPYGDDPAQAEKITEVITGEEYRWEGHLTEGTFKFLLAQGQSTPSLNRGANESSLVERTSESDPDNRFTITDPGPYPGTYTITIDRVNMKIATQYTPYSPPYAAVYLIGNATSAEWDIGNGIQLNWAPATPHLFTATTALKAGELKLHTEKDWGSACYRPMAANGSIQENGVQVYQGGDDLKWVVKEEEAGNYLITLDVYTLKITFAKQ